MNIRSFAVVLGTLCLAGCGPAEISEDPQNFKSIAQEIAQNAIIIDGHIDLPYRIIDQWEDVSTAT